MFDITPRARPFVTLVPILAAFAALAFRLASILNIWQDEAYSLHTTSGSVSYAFRQALVFEAQAPLYFVLLRLWRALDPSVAFARSFSIGCVLAAIVVVYLIARRWLPRVDPALPTLAFAVNPFVVWAAVEIRLYAFALLLTALLTLFFLDGFVATEPRRGARVLYVVTAVAALYTQYYLAALIVANALVAALSAARPAKRAYALCLAAIAIATLPMAAFVPGQLGVVSGYPVSFNPVRAVGIVLETVDFVLPHGWIRDWTHDPRANAAYAVAGLVLVGLLALQPRARRLPGMFVTTALAIAGCFVLAIVLVHQQVVVPRHTVVLLIPALLAVFSLCRPATRSGALRAYGYLAVYAVFSGAALYRAYAHPVKTGDWRNVAAYVDAHIGPNDAIALFNPEIALPYAFYARARNDVVPLPRPENFDIPFDQRLLGITDSAELARRLSIARGARVWLVTADQSPRAAAYSGRAILERYVAEHFTAERTRHFDGTTVRELDRKATST